jgi:hypothetical protein
VKPHGDQARACLPEGPRRVAGRGAPLVGVTTGCFAGEVKCCLTLNGTALTSSDVLCCYRSRTRGSVSTGPRHGLDSRGTGFRFLSGQLTFLSTACPDLLWAHPANAYRGLKRQGREADH